MCHVVPDATLLGPKHEDGEQTCFTDRVIRYETPLSHERGRGFKVRRRFRVTTTTQQNKAPIQSIRAA